MNVGIFLVNYLRCPDFFLPLQKPKAKAMFKVYIPEPAYQGIMKAEEQQAPNARSYLYKLLKQQPVQLLKAADNERYKAHPENVLKNSTALYLLDVSPAEALNIQKRYGVMCQSSASPDISTLIDINDEHTTEEKEPLGRGWDSVLDSVERLPSNALILTDRYLFKNTNANYGNGFDNVRSILTELLPRELETNYQITVVYDKNSIDPLYTFDTIAKRLSAIPAELGYTQPVTVEVLGITDKNDTYYHLHNRRIVSNYFVVKMDYKLAAFNKTIGTAEQTIIPQVLFTEDSLNRRSSPPLKSLQQVIHALRAFSQSLSSPKTDHNSYLYAVNGQRMERCIAIRNRLIK